MSADKFTRREFARVVGAGALGLAARRTAVQPKQNQHDLLLYVGTYTTGGSEGIYVYRLSAATGELRRLSATGGVQNPSFLALRRRRNHLYAVSEVGGTGAVAAFEINRQTGALRLINQQPSRGAGPCYVTVDRAGQHALAANYGSGSVCVLPIKNDGSLAAPSDSVQHQGSGANPQRQEGPHAHCIVLDAANRFAFAPDLGLDKVMIYRFDAAKGKLTPHAQPYYQTRPGAGPRHFTFHPNGKFAFVINELDSTLSALGYDPARGALIELHTASTLPQGWTGTNYCADVHVHPNGKFVYGSNRGHDSIAVFAFDGKTGRLNLIETVSTGGKWPRNFAIDPAGTFLLAANQHTNNVVTYRIDAATGRLTATGQSVEIPSPVCLKFAPTAA